MKKKVFLIVLVTWLALFAYSFTPQRLEVSGTGSLDPAARAQAPAAMRVMAFDAGSMSSVAALAFRGGSFRDERTFTMGAVVVQHPGGTLMFDTGFGRNAKQQVAALPWILRLTAKYSFGTPVADQLKRAGIESRLLMGIVLTHVHWDHVSGLPDMPGVPVWVTQEERDFVRDGGISSVLIRGFESLKYRVYGFPDGPYLGWEHSYDVFKDGSVVLVHAGGHTPGSIIAFISPPTGRRIALIGDLAWQREGVDLPAERPWLSRTADVNPSAVREALVRLHRIQERYPDMLIVPAHDAHAWAALPHTVQ